MAITKKDDAELWFLSIVLLNNLFYQCVKVGIDSFSSLEVMVRKKI